MSSIESTSANRFLIGDRPVLRGADLMKEAESMPAEITDLGNGVVVERRGSMFKMTGTSPLSMRAMMAAFEATRMGGEAGRAMFDTYRKNNADQFDPSRSGEPNPNGAPPAPPPEEPQSRYGAGTVTRVANGGTFTADPQGGAVSVEGGKSVTVSGSAEDDFIQALYGSTLFGLAGRDKLWGQDRATLDGGDGDDVLYAFNDSTLVGGAGNDRLDAGKRSFLDGGDGDDIVNGGEHSTVLGGSGNDRLHATYQSVFDGGDGDDYVEGYDKSQATDLAGDNHVVVGAKSSVTTGAGNDRIEAGDGTVVEAGDGFNYITAGHQTSVTTGSGADMVQGGDGVTVASGAGDDLIKVGRGAHITAGSGDDRVMVEGGSTIHFNRGDGNDAIGGGEWGQAYTATDRLSSSLLSFGAGITAADLTLQRQGNDLLVSIGSDSITLKDVQRHGVPNMTFTDGSVLSGAEVEAMVGPAEPYKPASQVIQRWYDANAAYNAKLTPNGTASAQA